MEDSGLYDAATNTINLPSILQGQSHVEAPDHFELLRLAEELLDAYRANRGILTRAITGTAGIHDPLLHPAARGLFAPVLAGFAQLRRDTSDKTTYVEIIHNAHVNQVREHEVFSVASIGQFSTDDPFYSSAPSSDTRGATSRHGFADCSTIQFRHVYIQGDK